jgi:hypothetical protein
MKSWLQGATAVNDIYPEVSGLSHTEIINNKHSLRSNTKGYGGKTHYTYSQNDTTAPSDSCTICSSRSRRPVRKLLDTSSYAYECHNKNIFIIWKKLWALRAYS